jgi:hypothetical protein
MIEAKTQTSVFLLGITISEKQYRKLVVVMFLSNGHVGS